MTDKFLEEWKWVVKKNRMLPASCGGRGAAGADGVPHRLHRRPRGPPPGAAGTGGGHTARGGLRGAAAVTIPILAIRHVAPHMDPPLVSSGQPVLPHKSRKTGWGATHSSCAGLSPPIFHTGGKPSSCVFFIQSSPLSVSTGFVFFCHFVFWPTNCILRNQHVFKRNNVVQIRIFSPPPQQQKHMKTELALLCSFFLFLWLCSIWVHCVLTTPPPLLLGELLRNQHTSL